MPTCKVCKSLTKFSFSAKILKKYDVSYYQCTACGFLQTEDPYWLDEAYSDVIADSDTGLVMRNISIATKLAALLYLRFDGRGKYVDVAGGYGMLVRVMRDFGFDFYWEDKFCRNLLALGFEAKTLDKNICALTAFEVLEHVPDPVAFITEKMDSYKCRNLIFSTELYQGDLQPDMSWHYYSFHSGQHISFYTKSTFKKIADLLGLNFYTFNGLHILSEHKLSISLLLRLFSSRLAPIFALFARHRLGSLTVKDNLKIIGESEDKFLDCVSKYGGLPTQK